MESSAGKLLPTGQEVIKTPLLPVSSVCIVLRVLKGLGRSIEAFEQVGGFQPQSKGYGLESSQTNLLFTDFQIGNVVLADSGMFGKIKLPPAPLFAKITDSFPQRDANFSCHPNYSRTMIVAKSKL